MPSAKTVNLDTHAIATLRYIRESMDAAGSVAVPGSAGIAMGIVGLAATALSLAPDLAAQLVCHLVGRRADRRAGGRAADDSLGIGCFFHRDRHAGPQAGAGARCRVIFAGAVMTAVLWKANYIVAAPGTWLLLYGCALISASASIEDDRGLDGRLFHRAGCACVGDPGGVADPAARVLDSAACIFCSAS